MGTRDLILDAAERLLGVLGYSKTTMDDVAKAAGVGKRTIYVYFPSKEEVTLGTIDRIVDRLVEKLRGIAGEDRPAADRLHAMILA
jgi:AcrR family transcriptional regulator